MDITPENTGIIMYQSEDGTTKIDVRLENKTVWLTQAAMAELFQTTKQNISLHLRNIFSDGELERHATVKEYLTVQNEGNREVQRSLEYYNLDAIISVGYRVRSHRGVHFRKWATALLREFLIKGFVMNDERLKEGKNFGDDYFDELLERIRDIRASEKRFYKKNCDIYALSVDHDSKSGQAREFFATVQNKLHYAIHGKTAAELIKDRADAEKPNMGLTSWKGDKIRKSDIETAKNYLNEEELKEMNRIVTMYLDYAEDQAKRKKTMTMADCTPECLNDHYKTSFKREKSWFTYGVKSNRECGKEKLDAFLTLNEREVLQNAEKVRKQAADKLAFAEFEKYNMKRLKDEAEAEDDFDRYLKGIEKIR